ncbi:MAG: glycosyltransferase [Lachnospiraceae bacterium]|nr:glycosyltransferase [Lachnospiraceae bacterium]
MKVVHFSTTDYGGAYRAAERINACIKQAGIDSKVIVRTKTRQDTDCISYFTSPFGKALSKVKNFCNLMLSSGKLTTDVFGTDISGSEYVKDADVVILHWVNSFVGYRNVRQLAKTGKKIIWIMHDEWVYTNGVHCGFDIKDISVFKQKVLGAFNFYLKRKYFSGNGIVFVAVSNWIKERAKDSKILENEKIEVINNPLDILKFKPRDRVEDKYKIKGRKIILFGADKATSNENKGFKYLVEALQMLEGDKYTAICFGQAPGESRRVLENMEIIYTGTINNDDELINLYNMADVMVVPSAQEAFGYTCCEALSCGTPVVAFDTSGLKDQIIHKENGYLARLFDVKDLCKGIQYCIENKDGHAIKAMKKVREKQLQLHGSEMLKVF